MRKMAVIGWVKRESQVEESNQSKDIPVVLGEEVPEREAMMVGISAAQRSGEMREATLPVPPRRRTVCGAIVYVQL